MPTNQLSISPELKLEIFGEDLDKPITKLKASITDNSKPKETTTNKKTKKKQNPKQKQKQSTSDIPELNNWRELGYYLETLKPVPVKQIDSNKPNSRNPLSEPLTYKICNHCDNPIFETSLSEHVKFCKEQKKKKELLLLANMPSTTNGNNHTTKKGNSKKRKLDETKDNTPMSSAAGTPAPDDHKPPAKKKKTTKKKKESRPKTQFLEDRLLMINFWLPINGKIKLRLEQLQQRHNKHRMI
ncbi:unnamed protein product [Ambrosiozyma monospora]|uniref:Unnamed protein product n=1 Tax=Ambrosiozyma monospora TaxID=43982 RepID=A0A9W7DH41_AMBMO|nr:unnamed protein product [Ambrosiozyma monospora]